MTLDVSSVRAVLDGSARWCSLVGDVRQRLRDVPDGCAQTCVTSPPYWGLRDYGAEGQIGREPTPEAYVAALVEVFREVQRTLANDGTLWLNLGDTYAVKASKPSAFDPMRKSTLSGGKDTGRRSHGDTKGFDRAATVPEKNLIGVPWMVAFALRAEGWFVRAEVVWHKPNPMPERVEDRPTRAHEIVFLLTKRGRYFYDSDAIREPSSSHADEGRNARDVWTIAPDPYDGAHFATMPAEIARRCILAGSRRGDVVLDPFFGAATTGLVALQHGRRTIGCELNPDYVALQRERLAVFDADAVSVAAPSWGPLFGGAR